MGLPLYFGSVDAGVDADAGASAGAGLALGVEDVPLERIGGLVLGVDFLGGAGFTTVVVIELDTFARGLFSEMPDSVGCDTAALGCPSVDAGFWPIPVTSVALDGRPTSFSTSCSTVPSDPCPAACCPSTLASSTGRSSRSGCPPSGLLSLPLSFPLTLALLLSPGRLVLVDRGWTSTVTCLFTTIPLRLALPLGLLGEFPLAPPSAS